MQDENVTFCRIMLAGLRREAAEKKVPLPKKMTCLKSTGKIGAAYWLVEGQSFRMEVWAHNAYEARCKVIEKLIDQHEKKTQNENR